MIGTGNGAGGAADSVDAARLMRHLEEFSRWVKLSGSAEEAKSLAYVEKEMAAYGYRTQILHHPAYISLPGPARVAVDGREVKAITHSMSQSSPAAGTSGRLVHVGKGGEADFEGKALAGAIVLIDGMASPATALRASRAGAVGQLHISPHEHLHEMCISPVWGSPGASAMADMPTTVALTIDAREGKKLRERLARGEEPRVTLHAEVDTGWRPTPILVADMDAPGADEHTPFILFSGHHDTWYEGVMDNGAANATMMEVARLSAGRRSAWRRGLRFCFWSGHSHGRYSGSAWYADTFWRELDRRCAVHVNVDSTGGIGAADFSEAAAAAELGAVANDALAVGADAAFSGKRLSRNSDQSFWGIGIPSVFGILSSQSETVPGLRNPLGWWWHTPHDLIDKIDPAFLERDTRVYQHLLTRLLTDEVLPLDIAVQIEGLQAALAETGIGADHGIAIDELMSDVEQLKAACRSLGERTKMVSEGAALEMDRLLMRLSRALVPIDYTSGDRFAHDAALPQVKWPALDPLRRFAAAPKSSDEWYGLQVEARRALNIVADAVDRANRELRQFFARHP